MTRILLVEDDESLGLTLQEQLTIQNHQVSWCQTFFDAMKEIEKSQFDLCIFDVTLPDGSGFDLAKAMRKRSSTPFLFLTAMSEAENRLLGFELGADEFIPKPFHLKELFLRIKHVLKDHRTSSKSQQIGNCEVDFEAMRIHGSDGSLVSLGTRDIQVLKFLVERAPKVVSRNEILEAIWGADSFPSDRTVDNSILRIRQVLGDEHGEIIRSVRRIGYQYEGGKS